MRAISFVLTAIAAAVAAATSPEATSAWQSIPFNQTFPTDPSKDYRITVVNINRPSENMTLTPIWLQPNGINVASLGDKCTRLCGLSEDATEVVCGPSDNCQSPWPVKKIETRDKIPTGSLPAHAVVFFNAPDCPAGWKPYAAKTTSDTGLTMCESLG